MAWDMWQVYKQYQSVLRPPAPTPTAVENMSYAETMAYMRSTP